MKSLEERFGKWWSLTKNETEESYFKVLGSTIAQRRKVSEVYPVSDKVFRAFELTDPDNIMVIWIGLDPYNGWSAWTDQPIADGLAFSTHVDDRTPPSLSKIHQAKQKFESDYLAAKMPERQSQIGTLDYDNNAADQRHIKQLIGNKTDEFNKLGQVDVTKWGDFSPTSLSALRSKKNVLYTIEKRYDGSANLIVTDGAEKQTIPMTSGELYKFFPNIAQGNPWSDIKNQVMSSASHTTNVLGVGDDSSLAVNAKFSGYQAPHLSSTALAPLVRFDVEGAADNDGGDNDSFILKMYVNNNSVWVPGYVGNRFTSLASVQEQMKQIGPGTVSDFLKIHK